MYRICICLLSGIALVLVSSIAYAVPEVLEGEWVCTTNQADYIKFYGNRIGCRTTNSVDSCFQYLSAGSNSMSLNFGGGELEVVTYECGTNSLEIIYANQVTVNYTPIATVNQCTSLCRKGLLQIVGAQSICRQDNPSAFMIPIGMIMQYLAVMPICPDGGTYFIQPGQEPRCSFSCCNQQ